MEAPVRTRGIVLLLVAVGLIGLGVWFGFAERSDEPAPIASPRTAARPPVPDDEVLFEGTPEAPKREPPPAPIEPEAADGVPRDLERQVRGDPAVGDWMEEVPEVFHPDTFPELVDELLAKCGAGHQVIDVACDEAPCMVAWIAPPDERSPGRCPEWAVAFGTQAMTRVAFDVDCPDGRRVRAELATPQTAVLDSVADPDAWNGGRMAHRATAYTVADWCDGG